MTFNLDEIFKIEVDFCLGNRISFGTGGIIGSMLWFLNIITASYSMIIDDTHQLITNVIKGICKASTVNCNGQSETVLYKKLFREFL